MIALKQEIEKAKKAVIAAATEERRLMRAVEQCNDYRHRPVLVSQLREQRERTRTRQMEYNRARAAVNARRPDPGIPSKAYTGRLES